MKDSNNKHFRQYLNTDFYVTPTALVAKKVDGQFEMRKATPITKNSYLRVRVNRTNDDDYDLVYLHRMVLLTWDDETTLEDVIKNDLEVHHIDGDPQNNNLGNLKWVTRSENMLEYYKDAKPRTNIAQETGMKAIYSDRQIRMMRKMYDDLEYPQTVIAEMFGVSQPHVSRIVNNKSRIIA